MKLPRLVCAFAVSFVAFGTFTPGACAAAPAVSNVRAAQRAGTNGEYLVIDLSAGPSAASYPVTALDAVPEGGWTDEHKTTQLVLRRIPAGSFIMGSPESELGRLTDETQHQVTLTNDFYMGVFEVTQKQYERVMGDWPSYFSNAAYQALRPVEQVSWSEFRGGTWPGDPAGNGLPASGTLVQRLRERTGIDFDLPTESQWEYACRAETTTALNSGKELTGTQSCPNMAEVGRYWYNGGSGYTQNGDLTVGTAAVGSYLPNAWGLYDMHGNVWEWCLDWFNSTYPGTVTDPAGPATGSSRVYRGGGWGGSAKGCRSAQRGGGSGVPADQYNYIGFRLAAPTPTLHAVIFDLGTYGTRTGGGVLSQTVGHGSAAVAPEFDVASGWSFLGWSQGFSSVTGDLLVEARYVTTPVVSNVLVSQRPGTKVVDISYDLAAGGAVAVSIAISSDGGTTWSVPAPSVSGAVGAGVVPGTSKAVVWDMGADWPGQRTERLCVAVTATPTDPLLYLVIDVSAGPEATSYPVSYLSAAPAGGWTDEHKTDLLVLRRVPAGTFMAGSPAEELGREPDETQHGVALTGDFYTGVFEVTQKQWERVMGTWPSYFNNGTYRDTRPVEQVSWDETRGGTWPGDPAGSGAPAEGTFVRRLRDRTGIDFDLPTEAQWEYACRAGSTKALNSNEDLTSTTDCPNMAGVGRYRHDGGLIDGVTVPPRDCTTEYATMPVGSYAANAWNLYDMHGNVWEWCLDWYAGAYPGTAAVSDPAGPVTAANRVIRGGSYYSEAYNCRSPNRHMAIVDNHNAGGGFRLCSAAQAISSPGTSAATTADSRDYTLTVISGHSTPTPGVGVHTYAWGSTVTCSVADDSTSHDPVGWTGTGSVPATGAATTTGELTLDDVGGSGASTITWNWMVTTYTVEFDLGDHGTRTGGGGLSQTVDHGTAATEPEFSVTDGWTFAGWDVPFDCVTSALRVTAQYVETPDTLDRGLIVWYPFDGNALDASGNGNDGTVNGPVLAEDRFVEANSAYSFSGGSISCQDRANLNPPNAVTAAAWICPAEFPQTGCEGFTSIVNKQRSYILQFHKDYGLTLTIYSAGTYGGVWHGIPPEEEFDLGCWHHVAGSFDESTGEAHLYIDGRRVPSSARTDEGPPATLDDSLDPLLIGNEATGQPFRGRIDDVRVYGRALSALEIAALYSVPAGGPYTVTFTLGDHGTRTGGGELSQTVTHGQGAAVPEFTVETGWTFTGWDTAFNNVTSGLAVTAQYAVTTYTVTFGLGLHGTHTGGGELTQEVAHGGEAVAPEFDVSEGWSFIGWSEATSSVTGDLDVEALYTAVPVAEDDSYSTTRNEVLQVAPPGVLANDEDPEGAELACIKVSDPGNGTLALAADGSFIYTPDADFVGTDCFTYKANDGQADSGVATATIRVGKTDQAIEFPEPTARLYGDAPFGITATATSSLPVSFTSANETVATVAGSTVTIVGAGTTTITASQAGNGLWNAALDVERVLVVRQRTLTVTPDAYQSKTFGEADPALEYTPSGAVAGEIPAFAGGLARAAGEGVGTYEIQAGTLVLSDNPPFRAANYAFSFAGGITFSVDPKSATAFTVGSVSPLTYDGTARTPEPTVRDGAILLVKDTDYTLSYANHTNAGTATLTVTGVGNYTGTQDLGFEIEPQELTVRADDQEKAYDGAPFPSADYAISCTGFVAGEGVGHLGGELVFSGTAIDAVDAGSYTITPGGLTSDNYAIAFSDGTLTIAQAGQTIDFPELPVVATNTAPFALAATASSGLSVSFASSDVTVVTVAEARGAWTATVVGVGEATITASQDGDANWNPAPDVPRVLVVHPVLTVVYGSGGGSYAPGSTATIKETVGAGRTFAGWTCEPPEFADNLVDETAPSTDFLMPNANVTLTATYAFDEACWTVGLVLAGALPETLTFGMHLAATDGWDEGLDAAGPELPLLPAQAALVSEDLAQSYCADHRPLSEAAEFLLVATAGAVPVTLSWEPPPIPDGKYLTIYEVLLDGRRDPVARAPVGNTAVDMAVAESIEIPAGESRTYVIRYGDELVFDLAFGRGWNLVSLPIEPLDPAVDAVLDDGQGTPVHKGKVQYWNGTEYADAPEIEALVGYWVYTEAPAVILVEGLPVAQEELDLVRGWNLVGPNRRLPAPEDVRIRGKVWIRPPGAIRYQGTQWLVPGLGHWINAAEDATIPLAEER